MHDGITPTPATETSLSLREVTDRTGERGQGLIEYAFILILIAITLIIALQVLGTQTSNLFTNVQQGVSTATGH